MATPAEEVSAPSSRPPAAGPPPEGPPPAGPPPEGPLASEDRPVAGTAAQAPQVRSFWRSVRVPVWLAAGRVVIGLVLAHVALELFPQSRQHLPFATLSNGTWFGAFDRWDAADYVTIATHGYPRGQPALTAFFPGYSLLVRGAHALLFGSTGMVQTAMLVSWLAFAAASVLLFVVVRDRFGPVAAWIATALFCWSPVSEFFLSPYSESLFALEIIATVALLERRRFVAAALVAAYASATSPESVALTLAVVLAAWLAGRAVAWIVAYAAISGLGIAAYMIYLRVSFGSALLFAHVQKDWHRSENLPFVGMIRNITALRHALVGAGPAPGTSGVTYTNLRAIWILDDAMLFAAGLVTLYMLWLSLQGYRAVHAHWALQAHRGRSGRTPLALPPAWVMAAGAIVLIAACTTIAPWGSTHFSSTEGEARFVAVAMPLYGGVGLLLRRRAAVASGVVAVSAATAILFQLMYNLGYWVT